MYVPWQVALICTAKCAPRDAAIDTAKSAWLLALVAELHTFPRRALPRVSPLPSPPRSNKMAL